MIVELTDNTFNEFAASVDGPLLVDFYASWCSPCKTMAPILEEIAEENGERFTVAKIDVEENPNIRNRYGIQSMPTFIVFTSTDRPTHIVGAMPKETLLAHIDRVISN